MQVGHSDQLTCLGDSKVGDAIAQRIQHVSTLQTCTAFCPEHVALFFGPSVNGFTLLARQHSGESFMSLSQQTDGRHSNGCNSSPSPNKGFLRQMIPFQVDNRPTSQFSFSPLTVSVRSHLPRAETWQTGPRDNILQPKGGALLGSITHINDSFFSKKLQKNARFSFLLIRGAISVLLPPLSHQNLSKAHLSMWNSIPVGGCNLVIKGVGSSNSNCSHAQVSLSQDTKSLLIGIENLT